MIEVTVNRDGKVSTPSGSVFLGNKFENLDEVSTFVDAVTNVTIESITFKIYAR